MYAAVVYVSELVEANKLPKTKKEPWWKRRLEGKLKELSRDLEFVNYLLAKRNINKSNATGENTFNGYHFDIEGNHGSSKGKKNFVFGYFCRFVSRALTLRPRNMHI